MKTHFLINGNYLTRPQVGIERFAAETVLALDSLCSRRNDDECRYTLVVPGNAANLPALQNIPIIRIGGNGGIFWEQFVFAHYVRVQRGISLNLCNTMPMTAAGIVCIHDVFYRTMKRSLSQNFHGRLSILWHELNYWRAKHSPFPVFTVSQYSQNEITRNLHIAQNRIHVLCNGWEHFRRITADDSVFRKFPALKHGHYYFTLGSMADYKNIRWVLHSAQNHPENTYVITGKMMLSAFNGDEYDFSKSSNIIVTGYLTDAEIKALMTHCKALIFPSLSEGFGIPPLEALSLGRPVLAARSSCIPEIYGSVVHYFNPLDYEHTDPDLILSSDAGSPDEVLRKNTWCQCAEKMNSVLTALF